MADETVIEDEETEESEDTCPESIFTIKHIDILHTMSGESDENVLLTYLELARAKALSHLYPFGDGSEELPTQHIMTVIEIANCMLAKRGAEGEISHIEGDVARYYDDADIPASLLRRLVPFAAGLSS